MLQRQTLTVSGQIQIPEVDQPQPTPLTREVHRMGPEPIAARPSHFAVFRDPADVQTIRSLARLCVVLIGIIFLLVGNVAFLYYRKPDRIVVDRTAKGDVILDNRSFGATPTVSIAPDSLTREDKVALGRKWMSLFHEVDPEVRVRKIALQQVLGAMIPQAATDLGNWLKTSGTAARERDEAWSGTFEVQTAELLNKDTVRVLGTQTVKRIVNGVPSAEKIQVEWKIGLTPDPAGRKERNFNTGFLVVAYVENIISRSSADLLPGGDSAGKSKSAVAAGKEEGR